MTLLFWVLFLVIKSLKRPFEELFNNTNMVSYKIAENLIKKGYPYSYDVLNQEIVNSFNSGLIDSSKATRAIIWNSITLVSTIITSE